MLVKYGEIRSSTESYWRADPKHMNETPAKTQGKKHRKHGMFNRPHTIPFLRMFPNASKGLSIIGNLLSKLSVSYYNEAFEPALFW